MRVSDAPLERRRALVDSSAYLALLDRKDDHHEEARNIASGAARSRFRLVTTSFLVAESYALILSVLGGRAAREFLRGVDRGRTLIHRIEVEDEERAREIVFQYLDKDFSLVDCLSFAVMERLFTPYAFAFDRHFVQYGIDVLE